MIRLTQEETEKKVFDRCIEQNCSLIEPFIYDGIDKSILKLKCNTDGYEWDISYNNFLKKKKGCIKCFETLYKKEAENKVNNRLREINASLRESFNYKNYSSIIKLKCNIDGYEWETKYRNFIFSKAGSCNICAIKKSTDKTRKPQKEVKENLNKRLKEINASLREPFVYKNNSSKLKLKCNIDDYEWDVTYYCFVTVKNGCSRCDGQILYKEEAEENLNKRLKEINASLREPFIYVNNDSMVKLKCNIDGHERNLSYHVFVHSSNGCPRCSGKIVYDYEVTNNVNRRLKETNSSLREPFVYKNQDSKLKLKCNIDGHEWNSKYSNFVNSNKGCAKCAGVLKFTQEEAEKSVSEQCRIMNYELVESFTYLTSFTTKLILKCNDCGCIWPVTYNAFTYIKSGCPRCCASKGEREIENILKERNIPYITEKTFDDCKDIGFLKFDFYLVQKNICIEFDGIQHFESHKFFGGEESLKSIQKRDKLKTQYCINNNIELIRIPYYNFNNIKEILSNIM